MSVVTTSFYCYNNSHPVLDIAKVRIILDFRITVTLSPTINPCPHANADSILPITSCKVGLQLMFNT